MSSIVIENDPYIVWDRLRSEEPIHWDSDIDGWIISRYADVYPLVRNTTSLAQGYRQTPFHLISKNESKEAANQKMSPNCPFSRLTKNWLRFIDGPNHTRFRKLVVEALPYNLSEPTNVERLRPLIQKHVDDLIDKVVDYHQMDVMTNLAIPLPFRTQASILANASVEDFEKLWEPILSGILNIFRLPGQMNSWTEETVKRSNQSTIELEKYFSILLEKRRKNPQNDFITRLVAAQKKDKTLTDLDILQLCLETTVGGIHESSMALIGNGVYLLLSSGQFELLKEEPKLAIKAVEEVLRYYTSPALTLRIAKEKIELGGKTIKKGQLVFLNLAAANRDPEKFSAPDHFDITRPGENNGELAFGSGAHACIGRPLIRFVAQVVFETLASRLPKLKLQQWPRNAQHTLRFQNRSDLYLLESLPVTF